MLGILIIATGNPEYGNMAYNLAVSIKAQEDFPVAVVWKGESLSHLDETQKRMFDHLIELPEDFKEGMGAKLHLDELTPFERTLSLDADMVWVQGKPSQLFEKLNGIPFTGITEGNSNDPNPKYYFWAELEEIREKFKVDKVYQWRSEVLYFEKTKVFQKARSLNLSKLKSKKMFGASLPDELYFNIATAILKVEPHEYKWMPAYWMRLHSDTMPKEFNYHLFSAGSNHASHMMKKVYNNFMTAACYKMGLRHLFLLKSKKQWSPDRIKI